MDIEAAAPMPLSPRPIRMLVITAGWGACYVGIRTGLAFVSPLWFAMWRSVLAGAALIIAAQLTRRPRLPHRRLPAVIGLGLINVTAAFGLMFLAGAGTNSGVASTLANSQPLLIVLPAWLIFHEAPQPRILAGLAVGFVGLIITALPGGAGNGALLSLGSAVAITTGTLLARRLSGLDLVRLTGWQFLTGAAGLLIWAAATEGRPQLSTDGRFLVILSLLALGGTALTYLLWLAEIQRASLVRVAAWTMLAPVLGIALGQLFLSDSLSAEQAVGIGLILAALALVLLPSRHGVRHRIAGRASADSDHQLRQANPGRNTPRGSYRSQHMTRKQP